MFDTESKVSHYSYYKYVFVLILFNTTLVVVGIVLLRERVWCYTVLRYICSFFVHLFSDPVRGGSKDPTESSIRVLLGSGSKWRRPKMRAKIDVQPVYENYNYTQKSPVTIPIYLLTTVPTTVVQVVVYHTWLHWQTYMFFLLITTYTYLLLQRSSSLCGVRSIFPHTSIYI